MTKIVRLRQRVTALDVFMFLLLIGGAAVGVVRGSFNESSELPITHLGW